MPLPRISTNTEAVLWITASTALFSIVFASGKFAGDSASALQILFLRYLSGFNTLVLFNRCTNRNLKAYASTTPHTHFVRAICGAFGGVSAIYAAQNMPIIDATAIGLLDGVMVVLLGILLLKESLSKTHWLSVFICLSGAATIVISQNAFKTLSMHYLWPTCAALFGAILIAFEALLIKQLSIRERPMTVLLYVNFFGMLLLLIPAIMTWQSTSLSDNFPFLLLGPLAVFAQYLTIRGYRLANLSILGPVNYSWLIFAALIGLLWFGEVPSITIIIGSMFIITGGVMLARI